MNSIIVISKIFFNMLINLLPRTALVNEYIISKHTEMTFVFLEKKRTSPPNNFMLTKHCADINDPEPPQN